MTVFVPSAHQLVFQLTAIICSYYQEERDVAHYFCPTNSMRYVCNVIMMTIRMRLLVWMFFAGILISGSRGIDGCFTNRGTMD